MTPTLASPPPGVRARALEGEEATLERLLREAGPGQDDVIDPAFFGALRGRPVIEVEWPEREHPAALFPLVSTAGSLLSATWTVPLAQAQALLPPTDRLRPLRVLGRRGAITFFALHQRRGGVGPYRAVGAAVAVVLDRPGGPPLRRRRDPRIGWYAVELPCDSARAAEAAERLAGMPRVIGRAALVLDGPRGRAALGYEGVRMADLEVALPATRRRRRLDLGFQTFSLLAGRVVRTRYAGLGEGWRGRRGDARLVVGDHRRARRLDRLALGRRPVEVRVVPRLNWIVWGPEDLGPA